MLREKRQPLLCVVGPTASGKTDLAIQLALHFNGEVVSCDSMQVYKGMNIGTATPTKEEMCGVPHYMLDVVDPSVPYSAYQYVLQASSCIEDIYARGKTPIVCGGTGLYLNALLYGLHKVGDNEGQERKKLSMRVRDEGISSLYSELVRLDPESASRISATDERRIVRALEVFNITGNPLSYHHEMSRLSPRYDALILGIDFERTALYNRIDRRVNYMIANGLLDEVRQVLNSTPPPSHTALQAIGYKEFADALSGGIAMETAISQLKQSTRRLAKRQMTWFRKTPGIQWIKADETNNSLALVNQAIQMLNSFDFN